MALTLVGPALVVEGGEALYKVDLKTDELAPGASVVFSLNAIGYAAFGLLPATRGFVLSETFPSGIDFSGVLGVDLASASDSLGLSYVTLSDGSVRVELTNAGDEAIKAGTTLLEFAIRAGADRIAEESEFYEVVLGSLTEAIDNDSVVTEIVNGGGVIERDTDPARWLGLNGNTLRYEGIAGTELDSILVDTGAPAASVRLSDGVAFATLQTGDDDDRISVLVDPSRDDIESYVQFGHAAYQARILTGGGGDIVNMQSADNTGYVRTSPQDIPSYSRPDYYQSVVDLGDGDDYVYAYLPYQSDFLGGSGLDTAFFYGRLRDWSFELVDADGGGLDLTSSDDAVDYSLWSAGEALSSTARQNVVRGIEYLQFNDVLLDLNEALSLTGASNVAEGEAAGYQVALAGNGLARGQTVVFDVELSSALAVEGSDYAPLSVESFKAATGVSLTVLSDVRRGVAAPGVFTIEATANQGLAAGAQLANFAVTTLNEGVAESPEALKVTMAGFQDPQVVTTAIADAGGAGGGGSTGGGSSAGGGVTDGGSSEPPSLALAGPRRVREGAVAKGFKVKLTEGGLAAGDSLELTLRSRNGTARARQDFDLLTAKRLKPGTGIAFDAREQIADGVIRVTVTNVSGSTLGPGSLLARFSLRTRQDSKVEAKETFKVQLSSDQATIARRQWTTSIVDDDAASGAGASPGSGSTVPSPSFTPVRLPAGTFGDNFDFGRLRFDAL